MAYCLFTVDMLFSFIFFITLMFVYLKKLLHYLIIYSYKTNPSFLPCLCDQSVLHPKSIKACNYRNIDVNIFFSKYCRYIEEYLYITSPDGFQVNFLDFWKTTFQSMVNFNIFLWCNLRYCSPLIEIYRINIFPLILGLYNAFYFNYD